MGSRPRNSNDPHKQTPRPARKQKTEALDRLHKAHGELDESIGLIATIHRAFVAIQGEEGHAAASELEDQIAALGIGVKSLRTAYSELSAAMCGLML